MTDWLMIAVGVVLTVGTALFVAGEFSLVALDPSTVETRAATGDKRATVVQRALGRLSTLLSGAQVGITLTTVLLGYTMQAALANLLTDLMSHWMAVSVATGAAVVIALIVVNAFSMVMGELIPKNATLSDPMRAAGLVAPLLMGLGALTAVDVMTDRGRLHTLEADDSAEDVVHLARATGHSRFPVIGRDVDDVMGIVHLRRAIGVPYERRADVPVASTSLMTPAPRVPETMPLADLLVELRAQGSQMALVVDEYGGTAGVVTLEDAVEEVVGDVADEHDRRRAGAHLDPSGHWVVPGWMRPDELATRAAIQVPDDGPYETLGGLVMTELGRIPVVGDVVELAHASLTVDAMDGRRVTRLHVRSKDPEAAPGDQGTEGEYR